MTAFDDAVAALTTYGQSQYQEGAADQAGADSNAIDEANANAVASQQALTTLQQEFDQYKKDHPATPPPPPPPPPTSHVMLGGSFTAGGDESLYQSPEVARLYYGPGTLTADVTKKKEFVQAWSEGVRNFVVSAKDNNPSLITAHLKSYPSGTVSRRFAVDHEPENDQTAAAWIAVQKACMPAVRAGGGIPIAILMSYTLNPHSGRNINDWVLPSGLVDELWFDYYPTAQAALSQSQVMTNIRNAMKLFGVTKTGFGEYGVPNGDPTGGVTKVKEIKSLTKDYVAICYWSDQVSSSTPNYKLSPQVAAAFFKRN